LRIVFAVKTALVLVSFGVLLLEDLGLIELALQLLIGLLLRLGGRLLHLVQFANICYAVIGRQLGAGDLRPRGHERYVLLVDVLFGVGLSADMAHRRVARVLTTLDLYQLPL
jgi:hypothetical protein